MLGPLLFLIFINDLPDGITSLCKIFADDTSLFSKVYDIDISPKELNSDLEKVGKWASNGKCNLILIPTNRQMRLFYLEKQKTVLIPVAFNNNVVKKYSNHKHLGLVLHSKLDFKFHVDQKIKKYDKLIGLIRRLSVSVPRNTLLAMYKSFIRLHLDYGGILFDKPENENFQNNFKKVQYRACLLRTGAIQGTPRQKRYDELGLHSLSKRRWRNKLIFIKY